MKKRQTQDTHTRYTSGMADVLCALMIHQQPEKLEHFTLLSMEDTACLVSTGGLWNRIVYGCPHPGGGSYDLNFLKTWC